MRAASISVWLPTWAWALPVAVGCEPRVPGGLQALAFQQWTSACVCKLIHDVAPVMLQQSLELAMAH